MKKRIPTLFVMGPLNVGEAHNHDSMRSQFEFDQFAKQCRKAKEEGAEAVSTDVWLGIVLKDISSTRRGMVATFDWSHYDRILQIVVDSGLKWAPILSTHHCGGNINDSGWIPLPEILWTYLASKTCSGRLESVRFVSEQGKSSYESVSVWATPLFMPLLQQMFRSFRYNFRKHAAHFAEINLSLGPTGELRFPSYNQHDEGTGYPSRGALQCYSELALIDFEKQMLAKYGSEQKVFAAWESRYRGSIAPPRPQDVEAFFQRGDHRNTQYGRDLFDWYQDSLIRHGRMVMGSAIRTFSARRSPFRRVDIAAKLPGIGWRLGRWTSAGIAYGDRLAELAGGMLRTSDSANWSIETEGGGYRPILKLFKELDVLAQRHGSRVVLYFTCFEMDDGHSGNHEEAHNCLPAHLCHLVGREAQRQGVTLKGENALGWKLYQNDSWQRMISYLPIRGGFGLVEGYTFLRMSDILFNDAALDGFRLMRWAVDNCLEDKDTPK